VHDEELKVVFSDTHAAGLHSPTSTLVVFLPSIVQPVGNVSFLEIGVGEQESADFSNTINSAEAENSEPN